jgi:hypothetical protein
MVKPLTSKAAADTMQVLGGRTRAALDREKSLVLRSIKELEFDRAMGKVSEKDFGEMSARLRARATGLMRQLDAGAGYREQIEREIERRLGKHSGSKEQDRAYTAKGQPAYAATDSGGRVLPTRPANVCASCHTHNDIDARFCKGCGKALA